MKGIGNVEKIDYTIFTTWNIVFVARAQTEEMAEYNEMCKIQRQKQVFGWRCKKISTNNNNKIE